MADGVEEDVGLAAEDGAGHEVALLLALHHLPVPVDQGDVVGVRGRGLGQGEAAGGHCHKGRKEQRRGEQRQPSGPGALGNETPEHGCLLSVGLRPDVRQPSLAAGRAAHNAPRGVSRPPLRGVGFGWAGVVLWTCTGIGSWMAQVDGRGFVAEMGGAAPFQLNLSKHLESRAGSGGGVQQPCGRGAVCTPGESGRADKSPIGKVHFAPGRYEHG